MPALQPAPAEMTICGIVTPPGPGRCCHCGAETGPAERLAGYPLADGRTLRVTHCAACRCDTCIPQGD